MPSFDAIRPNAIHSGSRKGNQSWQHTQNDFLTAEEEARRQRVLGRIPIISGHHDFASFRDQTNKQFIKGQQEERVVQNHKEFTPAADTLSNFPSAAAEAESGDFKPYSPLINKEEDLRPGAVDPDKMTSSVPGTQQQEAPWEKRRNEVLQYYKPEKSFQEGNSSDDEEVTKREMTFDILNNKELRDRIATRAFYTSTTQKLYEGVDWANAIPRRHDPPSTVKEQRPDMVTQRIRRFEDRPEEWQKQSGKLVTWDYLQSRNGHYVNRPFSFSSQCKKVGQIPNYTGQVSGEGEKDVHGEPFSALTQLRLSKPRYTMTSKRGYIPGYTGCVLWTNPDPPLSKERNPRPESTARAHKPLIYPLNKSAFKHEGPLSRMVTLTHPFNPFNKKQPSPASTASGNRV